MPIKSPYTQNMSKKSKLPKMIKKPIEARVKQRYGIRKCEYPNCWETLGLSFHHIRPRSAMGEDTIDNLVLLCRKHHDYADEGIIPATEILDFWPLLNMEFHNIIDKQNIERLIAEVPLIDPSGNWKKLYSHYHLLLTKLRHSIPQIESLRIEVRRSIALTQLWMAGCLTSGLPANINEWHKSRRFEINVLASSAHALASHNDLMDIGIVIRAKHSLATNANAFGLVDKAVLYGEKAIALSQSKDSCASEYKAYLLRNIAAMHAKVCNIDRAEYLINKSLLLNENEPETYLRYAEILMLSGDLRKSEYWIDRFIDYISQMNFDMNPNYKARSLRFQGIHCCLSNRIPEGIDLLSEAHDIAFENDLGHQRNKLYNGLIYFSSNQYKKFIKHYGTRKISRGYIPVHIKQIL